MKADLTLTEMSDQLKQYVKTTTEIVKLEILKRTVMMSSLLLLQLYRFSIFYYSWRDNLTINYWKS